jgi:exodeoxyribonuclease VII large subunit
LHRTGSETLTVTQVLDLLKISLIRAFPSLTVTGEVVDPFLSRNGHLYLRLRDRHGELKVVMWRKEAQRLRRQPEAGEKILVRGSLTIFPSKGDLQMQAVALAWAGQGDKLAELRELKERLQAEGLLDRPKRALPAYPRRLGVVTSLGSAVLHDIFQCVRRRNPSIEIWLAPTAVSGPDAAWQIRRALRQLQDRVDAVIIARGGGSFEELLPFSDETLVRAAANYPLPLLSAIGHGSDSTLLDLVADAHAATPTAAAELASPLRHDLLQQHRLLLGRARQALSARLAAEKRDLHTLAKLCSSLGPQAKTLKNRTLHDALERRLRSAFPARLQSQRQQQMTLADRLGNYPWSLQLQRRRQELENLTERLRQAQQARLGGQRALVERLRQSCLQLGPGAVLKRGFAMVMSAGMPVTTALGRRPGEELELLFSDGSLTVTVQSVALSQEDPN